ncbi:MAG: hypothetical protein ACM3XM_06105, partial [Mycobacterium leprae]
MKAWRACAVVLALVVMAGLVGTGAGAAGDEPEGYCTADDKAVVTYWPPGWEGNYRARCYEGRISYVYLHEAPIGQNP